MEEMRSSDCLRLANAFGWLVGALVLWFSLQIGFVETPILDRVRLPKTAVPAVMAFAAGIMMWGGSRSSPAWRSASLRFLVGAALQIYLIPYLGWWRAVGPPLFHRFNTLLLAISVALMVVAIYRLAFEFARLSRDPSLKLEVMMSIVAAVAMALGFFLALGWSAIRAGEGDVGLAEWLAFIRRSTAKSHPFFEVALYAPLSPLVLMMLEVRWRALEVAARENRQAEQS